MTTGSSCIKTAVNGSKYLKISKFGEPTICIFETQIWINQYIYNELNITDVEFDMNMNDKYDLKTLQSYLSKDSYSIYRDAHKIQDELKITFLDDYDNYQNYLKINDYNDDNHNYEDDDHIENNYLMYDSLNGGDYF